MKTRSLLLYYPGYPFEPKTLTPSRSLASVAGSLLEHGHETRILDYGTVETIDRLVSGKPSAHVERIAGDLAAGDFANPLQTLHMLWHMRGADRAFKERRAAYARDIAAQLAAHRGLHFIAFMLDAIEDVASTLAIVRPLRERCPRLKIVGFGEMAAYFTGPLAMESNAFDCLCIEDSETTLAALAERIDAPHSWGQLPNLAFRDGAHLRITHRDPTASLSALPAPAYQPDAYPALKAEQKIRVFTVDECRPFTGNSNARPQIESAVPRVRSVGSVCDEMWRIGTLFGARAFHFSAEAAPASHVSAVAHEMLRRGMSAVYTRTSGVAHAVPATFPALYASGCAAISFPVDTGSQRLLDTFYGQSFSITDVERVLRCSKSTGMFTIARFTYPCPADDVHTRAETVRLIERTQPNAVSLHFPNVLPGTRWYSEAERFGYDLDPSRYFRRCVAAGRKFPLAQAAWRPLPHGTADLSEHEVSALHHGLAKEIEKRGISASIPEETVRLACIMGEAGRVREWGARLQQEFLRGDAMGIATLVDGVNEVACVSAKRMALRAPDSERLAVGN